MLTFASGGWVLLLAIVLSVAAVAWVFANRRSVRGDGRNLASYGYNLATVLVAKEQLIPAGFGRDALQALVDPQAQDAKTFVEDDAQKRSKLLVSDDRIIGVVIGGKARAYPVHVIAQHEIINDTLNDRPIAVTYSPLCDSTVVFDRTINGRVTEFGVSGLLLNSNLLMFDRQQNPKDESLWSQLQFRAIAGPAAENKTELARIPAVITRWDQWLRDHPDTTLVTGIPDWRKQYLRKSYNTYFANDELKFPVTPLWQKQNGIDLKTPIVAVPVASGWQVFPASTMTAPPPEAVHSFMFAWYAAHPNSVYR